MDAPSPLHRRIVAVFAIVTIAQLALWVAAFAADMAAPVLPPRLANKDFANYWIGARLALAGDAMDLFGPWETYFAHMKAAFGADYPWHNWSYPPHYLLLIAPLGAMPYKAAALVFLAASFVFFAFGARAFAGAVPARYWLFAGPAVAANIIHVQNGFLTAGLALAALGLRERRPVLSGVALGLLTVKPQLGLLLPLLFIVERRWQPMLSAALTAGALAGLSAFVFGADAWRGYVAHVLPYQKHVMMEGTGAFLAMMPSLFGWLRGVGAGGPVALAVHAALALALLAPLVWALMRQADPVMRGATVLVASAVLLPYSLVYDLGAACVALAAVLAHRGLADGKTIAPAGLACLAAAMAPAVMAPLASAGLPFAPVAFAAALVALAMRPAAFVRSPASSPAAG